MEFNQWFKYGRRRINLQALKEYRPDEGNIIFKYIDGTTEILYFFEKEKERNVLLEELDRLCNIE